MYRLTDEQSAKLSEAAESGMGYQLVRVEQERGSQGDERRFAILNAEWAIATDSDWRPTDEAETWPFRDYGWHRQRWVDYVALNFPSNAKVRFREAESFPYGFEMLRVETHGSYPAVSGEEVFYRYSAFANDRRLQSADGTIPAGTYLTSYGDTRFAISGLGAVARYALPNPAPALFRFAIGIPAGTVLMCGTAAPKFGQSGGGVELRTDAAVQGARVYGPEILPEW